MKEIIQAYFKGSYQNFYGKYLKTVKQIGGDEYQALCPFHDDKEPSFNFNSQTGQFFCHGCQAKGDIFEFYSRINNLNTKSNFKDVLSGIAKDFNISEDKKSKSRIVETYDYRDETGKDLFQVVKYDPKDFKQRRKNNKGDWTWNIKGVRIALYNLQAVTGAQDIFFCEGEKDCHSVNELGFVATTIPMGAGKIKGQQEKYKILDVLKGKRVFILPDNDKAGKNHAEQVATLLYGKAKEVRIVEMPGLDESEDVTDFIRKNSDPWGGDKAKTKLIEIVAQAPAWRPPRNFIEASDLLNANYEKRTPIIAKGIMPNGSHIIISGESGIGKSLFRSELALHLVMGWDWLGFEVPTARSVAIFQYENTEPMEQVRLRRMCTGLGISKIPQGKLSFIDRKNRVDLGLKGDRTRLLELVKESKAEVVIYDCLSNLHSKDENKNIQMREILDSLTEVNAVAGTSCILIHHFGKPHDGIADKYRTRGAQSIVDWCVTGAILTEKPHENKILRQLSFIKVRDGAIPKPLLLERDENFLSSIADEGSLCSPLKVREILEDLGGEVSRQSELIDAIIREVSCSRRSAKKFIYRAIEMKEIEEIDLGRGRKKEYQLPVK